MGLARHIVVAETDEQALAIARRAYKVWLKSFLWLFELHGEAPTHWERRSTFDILRDAEERGIAGSPKTVIEWLSAHIEATGANYLVGQHQFGDMTLDRDAGFARTLRARGDAGVETKVSGGVGRLARLSRQLQALKRARLALAQARKRATP